MGDITPDQYEQPSEAMPVRLVRANGSAFEDLTGLIGSPSAPALGTVNERLQAIHGRLADGSQVALVSQDPALSPSLLKQDLDGCLIVTTHPDGLPPGKIAIRRGGSGTINSTAGVVITGVTAAAAVFRANSAALVNYTVPAGKRLVIVSLRMVVWNGPASSAMGYLRIAGAEVTYIGGGRFQAIGQDEAAFLPGVLVATAGQAVDFGARTAASTAVFLEWEGWEENA